LYIVIVPFVQSLVFRQYLHRLHFLWVAVALVGMLLLLQLAEVSATVGDGLTLICAFMAAFYFFAIDRSGEKISSIPLFNSLQNMIAGIAVALSCLFWSPPPSAPLTFAWSPLVWFSVLFLVGASYLAFLFQVRAQRELDPGLVSLLCLLESPLAFMYAVFFLNESMNALQIVGMLLILLASFMAVRLEVKIKNQVS
jgi:drug/metabolite transporter (DMT)-like permease